MKDFKKSVLRTAILAGLMGMASSPAVAIPVAAVTVNGENVDILTSQQGDPAVLFETDNSANVRDGKDLVGTAGSAVQTTNASQGSLVFEGTSGVVGDIGASESTLKNVTIDVNSIGGHAVSVDGSVYADTVQFGGDSTLSIQDQEGVSGQIITLTDGAGILDFAGSTTLSSDVGESGMALHQVIVDSGVPHQAQVYISAGVNVYADRISFQNDSMLTAEQDTMLVTNSIDTNVDGTGHLMTGNSTLGDAANVGSIGSASLMLGSVDFGPSASECDSNCVNAARSAAQEPWAVNLNMSTFADMVNVNAGMDVRVADGADIATMDGAEGGLNTNANNGARGTLSFLGSSTITGGDVGSSTSAFTSVGLDGEGGTVSVGSAGDAVSVFADNVNFGADATMVLADGSNLTTMDGGEGGVSTTTGGTGTLTFGGSSTVSGGDLGSADLHLAQINLNGGSDTTVTIAAHQAPYTGNYRVVAADNIRFGGDSTLALQDRWVEIMVGESGVSTATNGTGTLDAAAYVDVFGGNVGSASQMLAAVNVGDNADGAEGQLSLGWNPDNSGNDQAVDLFANQVNLTNSDPSYDTGIWLASGSDVTTAESGGIRTDTNGRGWLDAVGDSTIAGGNVGSSDAMLAGVYVEGDTATTVRLGAVSGGDGVDLYSNAVYVSNGGNMVFADGSDLHTMRDYSESDGQGGFNHYYGGVQTAANGTGSLTFEGTSTVTGGDLGNADGQATNYLAAVNIDGGEGSMVTIGDTASGVYSNPFVRANNVNFGGDSTLVLANSAYLSTIDGAEGVVGGVTTSTDGTGTVDVLRQSAIYGGDVGTASAMLKQVRVGDNADGAEGYLTLGASTDSVSVYTKRFDLFNSAGVDLHENGDLVTAEDGGVFTDANGAGSLYLYGGNHLLGGNIGTSSAMLKSVYLIDAGYLGSTANSDAVDLYAQTVQLSNATLTVADGSDITTVDGAEGSGGVKTYNTATMAFEGTSTVAGGDVGTSANMLSGIELNGEGATVTFGVGTDPVDVFADNINFGADATMVLSDGSDVATMDGAEGGVSTRSNGAGTINVLGSSSFTGGDLGAMDMSLAQVNIDGAGATVSFGASDNPVSLYANQVQFNADATLALNGASDIMGAVSANGGSMGTLQVNGTSMLGGTLGADGGAVKMVNVASGAQLSVGTGDNTAGNSDLWADNIVLGQSAGPDGYNFGFGDNGTVHANIDGAEGGAGYATFAGNVDLNGDIGASNAVAGMSVDASVWNLGSDVTFNANGHTIATTEGLYLVDGAEGGTAVLNLSGGETLNTAILGNGGSGKVNVAGNTATNGVWGMAGSELKNVTVTNGAALTANNDMAVTTVDVAAGSTLNLVADKTLVGDLGNAGTYNAGAGSTIDGDLVNDGTTTLFGDVSVTGAVTSAGTLNLETHSMDAGSLALNDGANVNLKLMDPNTFGHINLSGDATVGSSDASTVTVTPVPYKVFADGSQFGIVNNATSVTYGGGGSVSDVNVVQPTGIVTYTLHQEAVAGEGTTYNLYLQSNIKTAEQLNVSDQNHYVLTHAYGGLVEAGSGEGTAAQNATDLFNSLIGLTGQDLKNATTQLEMNTPVAYTASPLANVHNSFNALGHRLGALRVAQNGQTGVASGDQPSQGGVWGEVFGSKGNQDTRDNIAGYDMNSSGFAVGADRKLSAATSVGISFSHSHASVDGAGVDNTQLSANSSQVSVYGSHDMGEMYLDAMVGVAKGSNDTTRTINVGTGNLYANGSYDDSTVTAKLALGMPKDMSGYTLTPEASLQYTHISTDSYTETGTAGPLALTVNPDNYDMFAVEAGATVAWNKAAGNGNWSPLVSLKGVWYPNNDKVSTTSTFNGGGTSFVTKGPDPANFGGKLGAGLEYTSTDGAYDFSIRYEGELRSDYTNNVGFIRFRYNF